MTRPTADRRAPSEGETTAGARLRGALDRLRSGWQRYWFSEGALSVAIARIVVAWGMILGRRAYLLNDYVASVNAANPASYRPVGILRFFGRSLPDPAILELASSSGEIALWLMLFGVLSRVTTAVALVSHLLLISYLYSFESHWSHGLNVVFLAHISLLFGNTGARLSVDALVRRLWSKRAGATLFVPRWPALLAQASVAFMFSNAAYWKLRESNLTLDWALSDNLRNTLVLRHFLIGDGLPDHVRFVASHEWLYKGLALGNLVSQALPLLAVVFAARPVIRLIGGLAFIAETMGLDVLMALPNPHWYPLGLLFVDWEWAMRRFRVMELGPASPPYQRAASSFIALYLIFYGATALFALDQRHRMYPFSSFPMYRVTMARKPYSEHLSYEIAHPDFVPRVGTSSLDPDEFKWLQREHPSAFQTYNLSFLQSQLATALEKVRSSTVGMHADALELHRTIFSIPAYPASPEPVRLKSGLIGRMSKSGVFTAVITHARTRDCFDLHVAGLDPSKLKLKYSAQSIGPNVDLPFHRDEKGRHCVHDVPTGQLLLVVETSTESGDVYFPGMLFR